MRHVARFLATLVVLGVALVTWGAPARAEGTFVPVSESAGVSPPDSTESYWGPLPDEASSGVTHPRAPTHSVEKVVLTPFYLVTYPVYIATRVLKKGLVFADEHGMVPGLGPSLPLHFGSVSMGPAVTAGGHGGFGGGGNVLVEGRNERDVALRYITTVKGMHRGSAGFRSPWGPRGMVEAGGGYRMERNARFFGVGPTSSVADLSYFTQEQSWAGVGYRRRLKHTLTAETKAIFTRIETRGPRKEDAPDVAVQFAGDLPEGFGSRSEGVLYSALLRLDTTPNTGRPEPGTVAQGQVTYFGPTHDETAFWRYAGEAGTFIPLWFTDRTLALRGAVTWTGPTGSDVVPFTRLATNHSGETLRGFRDYRWRDRGLVDVAAEYRWPVWALDHPHGMGVDAYAFLNSGQVFGDWSGIKARLWRTSFGGGFRLILGRGFGGRLEYARNSESTEIRLQADQMFDFEDMGLFGGNYHVAAPD
jgi:hypothetical protein